MILRLSEFVNNDGFRYVYKNFEDYTKQLIDFMQQVIAIVKKQIDMHDEFKSLAEELKIKKKKVET
jgi:hypothetical protein